MRSGPFALLVLGWFLALLGLRWAAEPLAAGLAHLATQVDDESASERAIALLVASGAHVAVVDAIRAIQRGDDTALARQADAVARLPAAQQELALAAVLAQLARGLATPGLVALAKGMAPERLIELQALAVGLFDHSLPPDTLAKDYPPKSEEEAAGQ